MCSTEQRGACLHWGALHPSFTIVLTRGDNHHDSWGHYLEGWNRTQGAHP